MIAYINNKEKVNFVRSLSEKKIMASSISSLNYFVNRVIINLFNSVKLLPLEMFYFLGNS